MRQDPKRICNLIRIRNNLKRKSRSGSVMNWIKSRIEIRIRNDLHGGHWLFPCCWQDPRGFASWGPRELPDSLAATPSLSCKTLNWILNSFKLWAFFNSVLHAGAKVKNLEVWELQKCVRLNSTQSEVQLNYGNKLVVTPPFHLDTRIMNTKKNSRQRRRKSTCHITHQQNF